MKTFTQTLDAYLTAREKYKDSDPYDGRRLFQEQKDAGDELDKLFDKLSGDAGVNVVHRKRPGPWEDHVVY